MSSTNQDFTENIRKSGVILARALREVEKAVKPGVTANELDALAEKQIRLYKAAPAFKNFEGFPASLCVSINDAVVHGIPTNRTLKSGDVVGLDLGVVFNEAYTDTASTVIVTDTGVMTVEDILTKMKTGGESKLTKNEKLLHVTYQSLMLGIDQVKNGAHVGDIGAAVQHYAEKYGYGVVRQLVGHGVGNAVHEEPSIPNFGTAGVGAILHAGQAIAIEPMITLGDWKVVTDPDGWTVRTADGSLAAHFEHTVLVTDIGAEILT